MSAKLTSIHKLPKETNTFASQKKSQNTRSALRVRFAFDSSSACLVALALAVCAHRGLPIDDSQGEVRLVLRPGRSNRGGDDRRVAAWGSGPVGVGHPLWYQLRHGTVGGVGPSPQKELGAKKEQN